MDYLFEDDKEIWKKPIYDAYNSLSHKLEDLASRDPIQLTVANERALLLGKIDWFLNEQWTMKDAFNQLYSKYKDHVINNVDLDSIIKAIDSNDFPTVAILMEQLKIIEDQLMKKSYQMAQRKLLEKIRNMIKECSNNVLQLKLNFNAQVRNDLSVLASQFNLIEKAKEYCIDYIEEKSRESIKNNVEPQRLLKDHIKHVSNNAKQESDEYNFVVAEMLIEYLNTLCDMFNISKTELDEVSKIPEKKNLRISKKNI